MPIHGGEQWLGASLASAASQDCDGIEFILIDSGDDDRCAAIAAQFGDRLSINYQRRPDMPAWTAKTNLAVRQARASHVAMLHQDDLWLDGHVASMRRAIAQSADASLLLSPSIIVDQSGRRLGNWRCPLPDGKSLDGSELAERLLVQNFVAIPAPVIRRDSWLAVGGLDDTLWYTADWDLYLKLARIGSTVYRTGATTAFRVHSGSLTVKGSADRAGFADQMVQVIDRHIDLAPAAAQAAIWRRAMASTEVNCALAAAMGGNRRGLAGALLSLLRLGPAETWRYLRDSRILERALPRLRARVAGGL